MKMYWAAFALKIDNLRLQERVLIFLAAASVLIFLLKSVFLDPQMEKQKQLSEQIKSGRTQLAAIRTELEGLATKQLTDPDATNKARLQEMTSESSRLKTSLAQVQKGLVSPDKMAALLEDILRKNGQLGLVSLKTLPVASLNELRENQNASDVPSGADNIPAKVEQLPATNPSAGSPAVLAAPNTIYRHGVEIVLQGTYPDMLRYVTELESMPWGLLWGNAKLHTETYPTSTLTLTFYTLSMDKKWLSL